VVTISGGGHDEYEGGLERTGCMNRRWGGFGVDKGWLGWALSCATFGWDGFESGEDKERFGCNSS
jgi:hypothetical protein